MMHLLLSISSTCSYVARSTSTCVYRYVPRYDLSPYVDLLHLHLYFPIRCGNEL